MTIILCKSFEHAKFSKVKENYILAIYCIFLGND